MSYQQSIVLGLVQGLTEFLPVSSSGHLILVPLLFGWPDQGLAFDTVTHLGTLAALLAYFRAELRALVAGTLSRRLALIIVAATIPAGVAGAVFGRWIETHVRSALVIAVTTAAWGIVMWLADRRAGVAAPGTFEPLERVTWAQGLVVGAAQALALVPGTSRSGITITAGLLTGLDRATAARYAFLLSIPITAAAGSYKTLHLVRDGMPAGEVGPLVVAVLTAFASGWFAMWFLVNYLRTRSLRPFVVYRVVLSAVIVLLVVGGLLR
ncbi:MAG: undecaprenyl-diphosphate phosphatase [Candidatus Rokuibacteriota bacterium]